MSLKRYPSATILGMLGDLEEQFSQARDDLETGIRRSRKIDSVLSDLLKRKIKNQTSVQSNTRASRDATRNLTETNQNVSQLHQEIATLQRRTHDIEVEMERVGEGAVFRRLRRERARLRVRVQDREKTVEELKAQAESYRAETRERDARNDELAEVGRGIDGELDRLQGQLAPPRLYVRVFSTMIARAHCLLALDRDESSWHAQILEAVGHMEELHQQLRSGMYRIDRNSDVIGGRHVASTEAVYACVACGDVQRALGLFRSVTDPSLFFHEIFHVFRLWCLGLYLSGRFDDLQKLLDVHRYSEGPRAGYVKVFTGLVSKDGRAVSDGLQAIEDYGAGLWDESNDHSAFALVSPSAIALLRLARERGLKLRAARGWTPKALRGRKVG